MLKYILFTSYCHITLLKCMIRMNIQWHPYTIRKGRSNLESALTDRSDIEEERASIVLKRPRGTSCMTLLLMSRIGSSCTSWRSLMPLTAVQEGTYIKLDECLPLVNSGLWMKKAPRTLLVGTTARSAKFRIWASEIPCRITAGTGTPPLRYYSFSVRRLLDMWQCWSQCKIRNARYRISASGKYMCRLAVWYLALLSFTGSWLSNKCLNPVHLNGLASLWKENPTFLLQLNSCCCNNLRKMERLRLRHCYTIWLSKVGSPSQCNSTVGTALGQTMYASQERQC